MFGGYIKIFLSWETSKQKKNGVRKVPEVGTAHLGAPGVPSWLFLIFLKKLYSKLDRKYFCRFFGVRLLTVSLTSSFSRFSGVPEGFLYVFFRCHSLDNITFNINGHTSDIMFYSLPINNLRVSDVYYTTFFL